MANTSKDTIKKLHRHLHRRLFIQLILFFVIAIVMFGLVILDAITSHLNIWWILLGAIAGTIVGYVVGKAFKLNWHQDSQRIIMNVDRTGFIIIILYVLIRTLFNSEAKQFVSGVELLAVTYSVLGGIMVGRLASMGHRIIAILRDQNIIS